MTSKIRKAFSLRWRITIIILLLVIMKGAIFLLSILFSGILEQSEVTAYNNLANHVFSRRNELQGRFTSIRRSVVGMSEEINEAVRNILEANNAGIRDPLPHDAVSVQVYDAVLEILLEHSITNQVTGSFVVFDNTVDFLNPDKEFRTSIYIRNPNPEATSRRGTNIHMEYGPPDLARAFSLPFEVLWREAMGFEEEFNRDFYFKPIKAFMADTERLFWDEPDVYGFWNPPFTLKRGDTDVITYSIPLFLDCGTVYGVVGVELTIEFVRSLLPDSEIPFDGGMYFLGVGENGTLCGNSTVASGPLAGRFLLSPEGPNVQGCINFNMLRAVDRAAVYEVVNPGRPENAAIGAILPIHLYEDFSMFAGDEWLLLGMAPRDIVLLNHREISRSLMYSIFVTVAAGLILSVFAAGIIFRPMKRLSEKIKDVDPKKPVDLGYFGAKEIDELSDAFELLSDEISSVGAKMFKIIELVDMPLGTFEIDHEEGIVQLSRSAFHVLGREVPHPEWESLTDTVSIKDWRAFFESLHLRETSRTDDYTEFVYSTDTAEYDVNSEITTKWIRLRTVINASHALGIVSDITNDISYKIKLEFEREHDSLTNLLNRSAFLAKAQQLMMENADKVGILAYADLDDLKFMNDVYGHDVGDDYIKIFAGFLSKFEEIGAVVCRISGDEFAWFIPGFSTKSEARAMFDAKFSILRNLAVAVGGGTTHKVRCSVGLAYYPGDSANLHDLIAFADYAMYEIKNSNKGSIHEFSADSYNKNSFIITMKDILNEFIEEKRCYFTFQPIVDVSTGEIYACEALIRSSLEELKTPDDILRVARAQSKLYQIEKLTFHSVLEWMINNSEKIEGMQMFINSIPNQVFTEADMEEIVERFGGLLPGVVFEVTENEYSDMIETTRKMSRFKALGAKVAIDDYGSGYSNDVALLRINPDFIKIDMNLVRNIDKDRDKQQLVKNIINYVTKKKIKIIAEGVETPEELDVLIRLGANYVQGYLLARPSTEIADIPEDKKELTRKFYSQRFRYE